MQKEVKVAKNTLALIAREALNKGSLFILFIVIGRLLGKELLGRYSLAIVISQIFFLGTELGLNTLLIREVAKEKTLAGKALFNIGILRLILGVGTMALIGITTLAIGARGETAVVIYLCGLSYFIVSIALVYSSIFRAFEKMELELFVALIKNIIFLPLAIWMLFNKGTLVDIFNILLILNMIALIISHMIFVKHIGRPILEFDFVFLKEQMVQTFPIWIGQLFGISYLKVAPLLLFRLAGEGAVGLYNAAFVVVDGFLMLASCFVSSVFPIISQLTTVSWKETKKEYWKRLRAMCLIFIPLGAIFIFSSSMVVRFFYGEKFSEIIPLFRLLTFAAILVALDVHNGLTILAIGRQIVFPFINGAGLLLNFIISIFFIYKFGYMGPAYALLIGEALIFILMISVLKNFFSRLERVKCD